MQIIERPSDIEKKSFEIITQELNLAHIVLPKENEKVIKRVIHTTADFDYAETLSFSLEAVNIAKNLINNGADIVTDTQMALAGINKTALSKFGGKTHCYMADEEVKRIAEITGQTRASVSMEFASKLNKPVVFVIGNAPTALLKLHEMIQDNTYIPAFVVGVPVGFVNVEYAKKLIMGTYIPYIVNKGRKGGSNVAAAIINAILYDI